MKKSTVAATIVLATLCVPASAGDRLGFDDLELAQTHVVPAEGRRWTLEAASESLHLVAGRDTLALVRLSPGDAVDPVLEAWVDGARLGEVALDPPAKLPPTESKGPKYATDRFSASIRGAWIRPGLQLRVRAANHAPSRLRDVLVGADMPVTIRILPFYLFGADDADRAYAKTAKPDPLVTNEMFEKWPVASLMVDTHPARRVHWPHLVIGPSGVAPAYVMDAADQQQSKLQVLTSVVRILDRLMVANGDAPLAVQYYAPLIQQNASGAYVGPDAGLGSVGRDTGAGDDAYRGIFLHEQGHAIGLPHAGEAFDTGRFPYAWGSLNGSAWGWDGTRREFLAPFVPATAARHRTCAADAFDGRPRAVDAQGRCIKQDPMQNGAGDEAATYKFPMFSDYNAAVMQRGMETRYALPDPTFPSGYKRWNRSERRWVNVAPTTTDGALNGFDGGFAVQRNVPVHAIALTISKAGTPGATRIYPPLSFTGALVRTIDPTAATQRAVIRHHRAPYNGSGEGLAYCAGSGCDYTLRVRYKSGAVRNVLLQGAFRNSDFPAGSRHPDAPGDFDPHALDPKHPASFRSYVVNVPGDSPIERIELLDTPMAWDKGVALMTVPIASWTP